MVLPSQTTASRIFFFLLNTQIHTFSNNHLKLVFSHALFLLLLGCTPHITLALAFHYLQLLSPF